MPTPDSFRNTTTLPEQEHSDRLATIAFGFIDALRDEITWPDTATEREIAERCLAILGDTYRLAFENRNAQSMRTRLSDYRDELHDRYCADSLMPGVQCDWCKRVGRDE